MHNRGESTLLPPFPEPMTQVSESGRQFVGWSTCAVVGFLKTPRAAEVWFNAVYLGRRLGPSKYTREEEIRQGRQWSAGV